MIWERKQSIICGVKYNEMIELIHSFTGYFFGNMVKSAPLILGAEIFDLYLSAPLIFGAYRHRLFSAHKFSIIIGTVYFRPYFYPALFPPL